MQKIAIFASGNGSNALNLINYFAENSQIEVALLACNKQNAPVLEKVKRLNVLSFYFSKEDLNNGNLRDKLISEGIDYIVLAGFLWLIPSNLVEAFPDKIINIHPALLPKYGGKGMYGKHVHAAVAQNNEQETGITVHFVNNNYDEGQIIEQVSVPLNKEDDAATIEQKVRVLELAHFPRIIEKTLLAHDEV